MSSAAIEEQKIGDLAPWSAARLEILTIDSGTNLCVSKCIVVPRDMGEGVVIGRGGGVWLALPDAHVSRRHARLLWRQGRCYVVDERSRWGTLVNGVRVEEAAGLDHGDVVTIGATQIRFLDYAAALAMPIAKGERASGAAVGAASALPSESRGSATGTAVMLLGAGRAARVPLEVRPPALPPSSVEQNIKLGAWIALALCALYLIVWIFGAL